jgi:starvation-inducible DNA-binding protein
MRQTKNDLPLAVREKVIVLLHRQLADAIDLRSQVKQAHWCVRGPHFQQLHLLFDELAEGLDEPIDDLAERIAALGGVPHGTIRMAAGASRLAELPLDSFDGMTLVGLLVDRFASVALSTRAAIDLAGSAGDADAADLFTQISRDLDKHLWFLESHLSK